MPEEKKPETRGRKSIPKDQRKPPQATVKINSYILPFVQELKSNLKKGNLSDKTVIQLFDVLQGNWKQSDAFGGMEQQDNLIKLVNKYDKEHMRVIKLESKIRNLDADKRLLQAELEQYKHKEHNCQALKANGNRCTRPATVKATFQNIEINSCLQHKKILQPD